MSKEKKVKKKGFFRYLFLKNNFLKILSLLFGIAFWILLVALN